MFKKIFNGDNQDKNILDKIPNNSIDIVFTSPPYNLGKSNFFGEWYQKNAKQEAKYKGQASKDNRDDYAEWLTNFVKLWLEKAEYVFLNLQSLAGNKISIIDLKSNLKKYYCDTIIWYKGHGIPHGINSKVMTNVYEEIFIFSKKGNKRVGTKEWNGTIKNVIELPGNLKNEYADIHKAVFPIELPLYIIENFVKAGGTVADPFMGLGTTGLASKKLGMNFIGVEIDKEYFEIATKRIEEMEVE